MSENAIQIDDIVETANHFRCIYLVIESAKNKITEKMIKNSHFVLKNGTTDSRKEWFAIGEYKAIYFAWGNFQCREYP